MLSHRIENQFAVGGCQRVNMASEAKCVDGDSSSQQPEMNESSHETANDPLPRRTENTVQVEAGLKVGRLDGSETTLEECFYKV